MTFLYLFALIKQHLQQIYSSSELLHIAKSIFSKITSIDYEVLHSLYKERALSSKQACTAKRYIEALRKQEPLQYVLEEAYFLEERFFVNKHTFIPRPETEQIIALASSYAHNKKTPLKCLDIGTGSGCIAISIKKKIRNTDVVGVDISLDAIRVATHNAAQLEVLVDWEIADMNSYIPNNAFDMILSNPPYIKEEEKDTMSLKITKYEPSLALYTPNKSPLHSYTAILRIVESYLNTKGFLCVEVHEQYAKEVANLFSKCSLHAVHIHQDVFEKNRFVSAIKL